MVEAFIFTTDSFITQTVGVASTAVERVISYDGSTGVLKILVEQNQCWFQHRRI